jgi:3-oxoacyl-[acyl-carrier-protein] synthase I
MSEACVIVGFSLRTGLGNNADETLFGYRAGHGAMREAALVDRGGSTITMCVVPTIDPYAAGPIRLLALAEPAVDDLVKELGDPKPFARVVVHLAVSDGRLPTNADDTKRVALPLADRFRAVFGERTTTVPAADVWALAGALDGALDDLRAGLVDLVIVGAVHSDHDPRTVEALQAERRLFSQDRLDALLPGEGASFVALARGSSRAGHTLPSLGTVRASATAREKATPQNDEPAYTAKGLTHAVRTAFEACGRGFTVGWCISDATFETRELYEYQAVTTRLQRCFRQPNLAEFPSHRLGHLGPVALPLGLSLACHAWDRGYAPDTRVVLFLGSDDGGRAAVIASAPSTSAAPDSAPRS